MAIPFMKAAPDFKVAITQPFILVIDVITKLFILHKMNNLSSVLDEQVGFSLNQVSLCINQPLIFVFITFSVFTFIAKEPLFGGIIAHLQEVILIKVLLFRDDVSYLLMQVRYHTPGEIVILVPTSVDTAQFDFVCDPFHKDSPQCPCVASSSRLIVGFSSIFD